MGESVLNYCRSILIKICFPLFLLVVLTSSAMYFYVVPEFQSQIILQKKTQTKELVTNAINIIDQLDKRVKNKEISLEFAKSLALDQINSIRHGVHKKNYFWVTDMTPVMLMHPYRKDLIGKELSAFKEVKDRFLFVEFVNLIKDTGEGFVYYDWQKDGDLENVIPKVSFIKGYEEWNWILGSGFYSDVLEEEINALSRNLVLFLLSTFFITCCLLIFVIRQSIIVGKQQELLKSTNEKLESSNDEVTQLLNVMSHDLRAPLNSFVGYAEILADNREGNLTEQQVKYAKIIYRNGNNLLLVIDDILEFGKLHSNKNIANKENININHEIQNCVDVFSIQANDKQITLSFENKNNVDNLFAIKSAIIRILDNLVSNALKFTPRGGNVTIRLSNNEMNSIVIEIIDTGVGIPKDKLETIFDKFSKSSTLGTEGEKSTGLGMSITKQLIDLHQASIEVSSTPDKGTTMKLTFPTI